MGCKYPNFILISKAFFISFTMMKVSENQIIMMMVNLVCELTSKMLVIFSLIYYIIICHILIFTT